MASLAPTQSPDSISILVHYRAYRADLPVYVASNASDWVPEQMSLVPDSNTHDGSLFEHTIKAPRDYSAIVYKFRVGDGDWVHHHEAPTEPDGFWGMNNRFDIPSQLPPTPPPEVLSDSITLPASADEAHEDADKQRTALPSPAASPRSTATDSGTEIEAPSVSDWERASDVEGASDSEIAHGSPTPSARAAPFSMSEPADWIVL